MNMLDPLGLWPRAVRVGYAAVDRVLMSREFAQATETITRSVIRAGVIERLAGEILRSETPDRLVDLAIESEFPEHVADRLLEGGVAERAAAAILDDPALERLIREFVESRAFAAIISQVLESDELWRLIDEIARSPAVTEAITHQGFGFADQVAGEVGRRSRRADERLEVLARRLLRRDPPAGPAPEPT